MSTYYPKIVALTGAGTSPWVPIDLSSFHNGVGLVVTFDGSACGYDVDVTGDRLDLSPSGPIYHNKHDCLQGLTAGANGNLAYPVTAVRLNASTVSGGTLQLSVIQTTD